MEENNCIEAAPNEGRRIATYGLATCTAVAIIANLPSGSRHGYIQHNYDARPGDIWSKSNAIDDSAMFIIPELDHLIQVKANSIKIIIVYPANLPKNEAADTPTYVPVYSDQLNKLDLIIKEKLDESASIKMVPYLEYTTEVEEADVENKYFNGSNLMIDFMPDGSTSVLVNSEKVELDN